MLKTKYLEIADELEDRIASQAWKHALPGVATLSKELGVNSRTVTKALRVLSDKGRIEIKPSSGAYIRPKPRGTKYRAIGAMGLLHSDKLKAELIAIEQQAKTKDYHVLNVEHSHEIFQSNPNILLDIPVDGFVFTNSKLTNDMVGDLKRKRIPFISVNRISDVEGINWVDFNHERAHTEILNQLINLGHRRIAYVSFHAVIQEHNDRMRHIYQSVLEPKGLFDPMLYVDDGDRKDYYKRYGEHYKTIYGMETASLLMRMTHRPTAVIIADYDITHGFVNQARKTGFDVPDDLSVVAISQNRQQAQREEFLTMISGSVCHKAQRATELLMEIIESPDREPAQEFIELDIIDRGSTGPCTS